ncbi:MAG: DUF4145 domain-containing protein [Bacteroidales bacterium]
MIHKIKTVSQGNKITFATTCPHCGNNGTFQNVFGQDTFESNYKYWYGSRKCPNPKCNGHIFFISDPAGQLIKTYPSLKISFNSERIPDRIKNTFDEALICHANNCFIASAIMIRKTLEEICLEKSSEGENLFKRIENLKSKIVIPEELINGMQELRLLGNDAAHIEAKTYEQIGKDELEISIEFTKEILKAVYQYESLLDKLRNLKQEE